MSSQVYGPRDDVPGKSLRMAMMHAANNGVKWISDVSAKDVGFSYGRNFAVEQTLAGVENGEEIDYIVWVDADIVLEPDSISRLVRTAAENGFHFLTGVYHQKSKAAKPVFYDCHKKWLPRKVIFSHCVTYPPNRIAPAGGCGFGFCITSVKMLQDIRRSKHWKEPGKWFPDTRDVKGGSGEDLSFCEKAIWCNYQLYVHTGIQVGHQGNGKIWTQEDFEEAKKKAILESGVLGSKDKV